MANLNPYTNVGHTLALACVFALIVIGVSAAVAFNWRFILQETLSLFRWGGWYVNIGFTYNQKYWIIDNSVYKEGTYNVVRNQSKNVH
jgi:hypothetical protein